MNLAPHELGMLSLFSELALVRAHGVPAIVEGLAPTPEYLGVLNALDEGLQHNGVSDAGDFRTQTELLRALLEGRGSPSAIFESQKKLGAVLRRIEKGKAMWNVIAPRETNGVHRTPAGGAALNVDIRSSRALHHLGQLVSIANTNGVGVVPQQMSQAQMVISALMEGAGFRDVRFLDGTGDGEGDGGNAAIFGIRRAAVSPPAVSPPATPPEILFVAGYDVDFPSANAIRAANPFSPYVSGGRLFGQGVLAKAGILAVIAAMEVFGRGFPLTATAGFYLDGDRQTGSEHAAKRLAQISDFAPELIFILGPHYTDAEEAEDFILLENIAFGSKPREGIYKKLMSALKTGCRTTNIAIEEYGGATLLEQALGKRFPSARIFSIPFSDRGSEKFEEPNLSIPLFVKWSRFLAAFAASEKP